jgi:dUTP pyrophosphatase
VTAATNKVRFTYLGYPIDQANASPPLRRLVDTVRNELTYYGLGFYDPGSAFGGALASMQPGPEIVKINHRALSLCTGIIAILPKGVPSLGTPMEIQTARQVAGMPVAILTDAADTSWALQASGLRLFEMHQAREAVRWLSAQDYAVADRRQPLPYKILYEPDGVDPTPYRAYEDDAGVDLVVAKDTVLPPGQFVDVECGIAMELPSHTWGLIIGRSSTRRRRGLLTHPGVIDAGYRGPLFAAVENLTDESVEVKAGERLVQMILFSNQTATFQPVRVDKLQPSARGEAGFGSSGS